MTQWIWNLGIASLLVVALMGAGLTYELLGERRERILHPAPGQMISVGDHRLHLLCKGTGTPTVVIEQGAGEASRLWWPVQDKVAQFARVCTYDRAGFGWSEAARSAQTIEDRADSLHQLLHNAGINGPYVLVAHSYGGLIVRCFARKHPAEVAGLVLVDTPEEATIFQAEVLNFYAKVRRINRAVGFLSRFGTLRLLRKWVDLDRFGFWLQRPAEYQAVCDDLASLERVPLPMRSSEPAGTLGTVPVAVITHGVAFPGPFAILEKNWSQGQARLAALSTNNLLTVATHSNHMIEIDEPELVVEVIHRACVAAREHRPIQG